MAAIGYCQPLPGISRDGGSGLPSRRKGEASGYALQAGAAPRSERALWVKRHFTHRRVCLR